MHKIMKMIFKRKFWLKSIVALVLVGILVLGNAGTAMAARTGGRIGGGSFRAPSRTYSAPRGGGYSSPGYGYGYGGGGFGFPFLLPFLGFGGLGGIFSILIFIAIANFLVRSFSNAGVGGGDSCSSHRRRNRSFGPGEDGKGITCRFGLISHFEVCDVGRKRVLAVLVVLS